MLSSAGFRWVLNDKLLICEIFQQDRASHLRSHRRLSERQHEELQRISASDVVDLIVSLRDLR